MWSSLIDQYKKDLSEFVSTVKGDTEQVLSKAAERFADVKKSYDHDDKGAVSDKTALEPTIARIIEDPNSLIDGFPTDDQAFKQFYEHFVIGDYNDAIADILDRASDMQDILAEFVPEQLTYAEFWARIYYLISQDNLARQRVEQFEMQEEELTWEGDDEDEESPCQVVESQKATTTAGILDSVEHKFNQSTSQVEELTAKLEAANREIERYQQEIAELKKSREDTPPPVTLEEASDGAALKKKIEQLSTELANQKAENELLKNRLADYEKVEPVVSDYKEDDKTREDRDDSKWSDEKEIFNQDTAHPEWEADGWSEWE